MDAKLKGLRALNTREIGGPKFRRDRGGNGNGGPALATAASWLQKNVGPWRPDPLRAPVRDQRVPAVAYFFRNLSTRPAVSTIFCLPV